MNRRLMKQWASATSLLIAASMICGRAEADPPYHFLDARVAATYDVLGTFTAVSDDGAGGASASATRGKSSAFSIGVELVHSWEWLPNYGGIDLVARLGFDAISGEFLGPEGTLYSPNIALGVGYVQPVNRYFQVELTPFLGVGASYISNDGVEYSGIASKYGLRGNFVVTIDDSYQAFATAGYSWCSFSFPDLGSSGLTLSTNGASVGGGLGGSF